MIKWKVSIEGLPTFFMDGSSASSIKMQLRKILRSPEMLQSVTRITEIDFKKLLRARLSGKDIKQDEDDDVKQEMEEDAPMTSVANAPSGMVDEPVVRRRKKDEIYDPKNKDKELLTEPEEEPHRLDARRKFFKDKNKQLLLARKKREERRERLQASYGEQTESTRPQSKFIHDILYK